MTVHQFKLLVACHVKFPICDSDGSREADLDFLERELLLSSGTSSYSVTFIGGTVVRAVTERFEKTARAIARGHRYYRYSEGDLPSLGLVELLILLDLHPDSERISNDMRAADMRLSFEKLGLHGLGQVQEIRDDSDLGFRIMYGSTGLGNATAAVLASAAGLIAEKVRSAPAIPMPRNIL